MFGKLSASFKSWLNGDDLPAKPRTMAINTPPVEEIAPRKPAPPPAVERPAASAAFAPSATGATENAPESAAEPVLVHREVLDEKLAVSGVEFFVRGELREKIHDKRNPARRFLDAMLIDQLASLRSATMQHRPAWLQLSESSLMRLGSGKLPAGASILMSPEDSERRAHVDANEIIATLQDAGHQVWLDDAIGSPWFDSLAKVANGATLRMAQRTPHEIAELFKHAREQHPGLKLGAWDVGTQDDYEMACTLCCTRFSGSFVTRRENWSRNELSPQMLNVALLINQIREETNLRATAQVLKHDMAMSYRLLRYVNAAAHGLNQKISSIEQGLMILGQDQLDRWLTLLLLSGSALGDTALTEVSLARARFLELIGAYRLPPEQCEKLFVLGLFSMLDIALKVPLEVAIKPLRLDETMNAALLRREGPFGLYLSLADACERGIASEIIKYAVTLGLTTSKVSAKQVDALNWVAEISVQSPLRTSQ